MRSKPYGLLVIREFIYLGAAASFIVLDLHQLSLTSSLICPVASILRVHSLHISKLRRRQSRYYGYV